MSEFRLTVRMNNDAFVGAAGVELARILRKIAYVVEDVAEGEHVQTQSVLDFNGNRVGGWKITEDES